MAGRKRERGRKAAGPPRNYPPLIPPVPSGPTSDWRRQQI